MSDEETMESDSGGDGGGGGSKKKIIIIIVAILLLAGIGGAAWFFLIHSKKEEHAKGEEEVAATEEPAHEAQEPIAQPLFLPLGSFIANIQDGRRYLKVDIQLMMSEPQAYEYLNTRIAEVKDIVLNELQGLTVEDTKQPEMRAELRQKLIAKISALFPSKPEWHDTEPIKKILFQEFVVQ